MANSEPKPSIGPLLLWSAVCLVLLGAGGQKIPTNDLHIFLAMGQWMSETGQIMEEELFTWTAQGDTFLHGPWGFSWLSWKIYDLVGLYGLRIMNGIAAATTILLIGKAALLRKVDPRAAAFGTFFAAGLMIQNLSIRSQTWVFPIFAGLLWCMSKPRPLRFVLPFCAVAGCFWANLHGSFPAGLVALGALGAGAVLDEARLQAVLPYAGAATAFAIGTCIGPYGPEIYTYVLSNSSAPEARGLSEWGAPDLLSFSGLRLGVALLIWSVLLLRKPRQHRWSDLLLVLGFGGLALSGARFIAWFGIAAAIPLAVTLDRTMQPSSGLSPRFFRGASIGVALYWVALLGNSLAPKAQELHDETPIAAVTAIHQSADGGRLFNPPEWGGYATLELGDRWLTSGDIRVWVFDDASWAIYPTLVQGPEGWEEALVTHHVSHLLLRKEHFHALLIPLAHASTNWTLLHEDEFSAAFERVR